jgi:hypothetical protein
MSSEATEAKSPESEGQGEVSRSVARPFDLAKLARRIEWGLLGLVAIYVVAFYVRQMKGIGDPWLLEWDARATSLPAWRYHETGYFPNDMIVDYMGAFYATPGWSLLFWIATLFTDPLIATKVLPLFALAVIIWQGGMFGYRRFGPAGAAVVVFMLVSTYYIWFRLLGFNARAFGFPFLSAFVRYADEKNEKKVLITLGLASLCYPSVLLLMGPSYGLILLARRAPIKEWIRLSAVGVFCLAVMSRQMLFPDPRFGKPPTLEQAATLRQMQPGSNQPFYPLGSAREFLEPVVRGFFEPAGRRVWYKAQRRLQKRPLLYTGIFAGALGLLAWRKNKNLPVALPAILIAAMVMYFVIRALAYRLYLPDRPLTFAYPIALAFGLPVLAYEAFSRLSQRWSKIAAALVVALFFGFMRGDGLVLPRKAMPNNSWQDTPALHFVRTLPKDVLIIALPEQSSAIQAYAQRSTLFSMHTNTPFFYGFAVEMDARFEEFYRAYYATSWEPLRKLHKERGVTHVVMDERDFGPQAMSRARYAEPWNTLLRKELLRTANKRNLVLRSPPPEAIVFHEGTEIVLDLSRLPEDAPAPRPDDP